MPKMSKESMFRKADKALSDLSDVFKEMLLEDMEENAFEIAYAISKSPQWAEHFFTPELIKVAHAINSASQVMCDADKAWAEERKREKEKQEKQSTIQAAYEDLEALRSREE